MLEGNVEPPPEDTSATSVPPLSRRDWDQRDQEHMFPGVPLHPIPPLPATPPLEDTSGSGSSDEAPLHKEVSY